MRNMLGKWCNSVPVVKVPFILFSLKCSCHLNTRRAHDVMETVRDEQTYSLLLAEDITINSLPVFDFQLKAGLPPKSHGLNLGLR